MIRDTELMIENLQHNIIQLADVCKRIQEENDQLRLELDEANDLLQDSYRYEDQLEVEIAAACTALEDHKNATIDFIEELTNCRPFNFEELAILNKYKEMLI